MSDDKPEALLRSALEKIVYFEARSSQLSNDAEHSRTEAERLKNDLASASQREIELRRVIAELEVRATRAHAEREETARVADALRRERAELIGKMLEASRIHGGSDQALDDFDLAQFIAQLRSEVLVQRDGAPVLVPRMNDVSAPAQPPSQDTAPVVAGPSAEQRLIDDARARLVAVGGERAAEQGAVRSASVAIDDARRTTQARSGAGDLAALTGSVMHVAQELRAQGRIEVNAGDLARLAGGHHFPGRSEETLFGFSVRELSALDTGARVRAAERLEALKHPAAAPALATALHAETEAPVQVALLSALASLAKAEAVPVVKPLLTSGSPEVRIAALKALLTLDAPSAGPHLAAAMKDPDKAVRRRASLLALGLKGTDALVLGRQAIVDEDADVRALAALVLGASNAEVARPALLDAMRDPEVRVRRAASQSLSRLLGQDVTSLVSLDDAQRRREVRRLATVQARPVADLQAAMAERKREAEARAKATAAQRLAQATASTQRREATERPAAAPVTTGDRFGASPSGAPSAVLVTTGERAGASQSGAPSAGPVTTADRFGASQSGAPSAAPVMTADHFGASPVGAAPPQYETAPAPRVAPVRPPSRVATDVLRSAAPARVAVLEVEETAPAAVSPELTASVLRELRAAIRGKPLPDLASGIGASADDVMRACGALISQGHVVRRGHKYFVA